MHILRSGRVLFTSVFIAMLAGCGALPPSASPSQLSAERTRSSGTYKVIYLFSGFDGALPFAGLTNVKGTLYGTTFEGGKHFLGTVFTVSASGGLTRLYSFHTQNDGRYPEAPVLDRDGTLYGTTFQGGANHAGTLFAVSPSGMETVLHNFGGAGDGSYPDSVPVSLNGTLYGTAPQGGAIRSSLCMSGCGVVFAVTRSGQETVLHSFGGAGDGKYPHAGLLNLNGTLYGTAGGGANDHGAVFTITASGTERVLYSFKGPPNDGAGPLAVLISVKGTLYGTTSGGGTNNTGTVFSVTPSGTETVLYSFGPKNSADGANPQAPLLSVNGTLYGTTNAGGGLYCKKSSGCGTVFAIAPSGSETVLHSFAGGETDGRNPVAGLSDLDGTLYGTTSHGGKYLDDGKVPGTGSPDKEGFGTIFAMKP